MKTLLEFVATLMAGLAVAVVAYGLRFRIQDWMQRRRHYALARRGPRCLLAFLIIAYIVTFSTLSLAKHINFHTHNDLAIHAQVMRNTSQGRWFGTTLLEDRPANYLGHHFSPALLLLTPLYCLWPDAGLLLILQTVLLGLGGVPIYVYAKGRTGSEIKEVSV